MSGHVITLRYNAIQNASNVSRRLSTALNSYADALSSRVVQSLRGVPGGGSSNTSQADFFVRRKIDELRSRSNNAQTLSNALSTLHTTAQRVDRNVRDLIRSNRAGFFNRYNHLRASRVRRGLSALWTRVRRIPILGNIIGGVADRVASIGNAIRQWWRDVGGWDFLIAVGLVALSVLIAIAAIAATIATAGLFMIVVKGVVALAAVISATIQIANLTTRIATRGGSTTLAGWLSENGHEGWARALTITTMVTGAILIVANIGKGIKTIGKFFKNGGFKKVTGFFGDKFGSFKKVKSSLADVTKAIRTKLFPAKKKGESAFTLANIKRTLGNMPIVKNFKSLKNLSFNNLGSIKDIKLFENATKGLKTILQTFEGGIKFIRDMRSGEKNRWSTLSIFVGGFTIGQVLDGIGEKNDAFRSIRSDLLSLGLPYAATNLWLGSSNLNALFGTGKSGENSSSLIGLASHTLNMIRGWGAGESDVGGSNFRGLDLPSLDIGAIRERLEGLHGFSFPTSLKSIGINAVSLPSLLLSPIKLTPGFGARYSFVESTA